MKTTIVATCLLAAASAAPAEVELSPLFTDHMVLQRELPAPVFGEAAAGERVSVSFAGQVHEAVADSSGRWMVRFEPLMTSRDGRRMVVEGSNTITLSDVLVGEVWFCSGQSNMAGKFSAAKGRSITPAELKRDHAAFRFCNKNGGWSSLDERTQGGCSRVGYYFGMKLYEELGVPIGLIQRASSGTPIQSWMEASVAERIRRELRIPEHWGDPAKPDRAHREYDAWIRPMLPVAIRGVIWYQGERNAKTRTGWEYRELLPCLIRSWREAWAVEGGTPFRAFPFYYVQVPSQAEGQEYPWLRDSMRRALDLTENTGMAIFYDHGPSLHPENKKPAGKRLALWALARDYGQADLVHCGPLLKRVVFSGDRATLTFDHVGGGLRNAGGGKHLKFFEMAGADAAYQPAEAWIEGDTVVVRSDRIEEPVFVRYLFWKGRPDAGFSLMNAEGIPASSFITDDSKPPREPLEISGADRLAVDWVALYEPLAETRMPCRVMKPLVFDAEDTYPVIVSLHGAGGRGTDNRKQLKIWNRQLAEAKRRAEFPCYVVAPQSEGPWGAEHLAFIRTVIAGLPSVDADRIYIMGHSMGGHGTYALAQLAPGYFAAAAPSAGSGLKRTENFIDPSKLEDLPIWAFHGDQDRVCPIARDREVFAAMKDLGGNMKFTTWAGDNHGVSDKMIPGADNGSTEFSSDRCDREPDFMTWLFKQRR